MIKRIFLSAALGRQYLGSVARLKEQVKLLSPNSEFVCLTSENLRELCPKTFTVYKNILVENIRGFGYFAWKPEMIYQAIQGKFGLYDEVVWIDAGCEVNSLAGARRVFKNRSEYVMENGIWTHALASPEACYTKKEVLSKYLSLDPNPKIQFQANYMHFGVIKPTLVVNNWLDMAMEGVKNLDFELKVKQDKEFIEHRNDQSLFSISCKLNSITPNKLDISTGRGISVLRSLNQPIWISRNRTGTTIKPRWLGR